MYSMTSKSERERNQIGVAVSTKTIPEFFKQVCDKHGLLQGVIIERLMVMYGKGLEEKKIDMLVMGEAITGPAEIHFDNLRPYIPPKIMTGKTLVTEQ